MTLDSMIDAVRAVEPRLDPNTRDAILDRIVGGDGPVAAVAVIPALVARRVWPRRLALGAAGVGFAAAAALVALHLGDGEEPARPTRPSVPQVGVDEILRPYVPATVGIAPPPVVAPPPAPPIIPPNLLESLRVAGEKNLFPDDATKKAIARAGATRLMVPVKVCIDVAGTVVTAGIVGRGSGFPAYDQRLVTGVQTWRYRPYLVDGTPTAACSIAQFVYSQK